MKLKPTILLCFFLVCAFLQAQSADEIFTKAAEKAKIENKNVLLFFKASWCGWCKKMENDMQKPEVKDYFDNNFVDAVITVEERDSKAYLNTPGGDVLLEKFGGKDEGLPYWVIIKPDGKLLVDSKVDGQNIGAPATEDDIKFFIKKLELVSKNKSLNSTEIRNAFLQKNKE